MNPKTKIFVNGKDIRWNRDRGGRFSSIKVKVTRFVKRVFIVLGCMSALGWATIAGSHLMPVKVYAEKIVEVPSTELPPIMKRIATCESQNSHDWGGQVALHGNKDGSVDVGLFQINNRAWGKKAHEMGLDLANEKDNTKMAMWIYENRGTGDWYSSASCWSK